MGSLNRIDSIRAGLLLHLERYQEALIELEELRQIAPKESLVYYLLSKVSSNPPFPDNSIELIRRFIDI